MTCRGFAAIGLHNPKTDVNVGGVLRAIHVYGAKLCVIGGSRNARVRYPTDTMKAYRHVPVLRVPKILDCTPFDCVPVAVDLIEGATPLPEFEHPERAFYVFGPEDGTIPRSISDACAHRVYVPMETGCMNLAATVNVILYDRAAKGILAMGCE